MECIANVCCCFIAKESANTVNEAVSIQFSKKTGVVNDIRIRIKQVGKPINLCRFAVI